MEKKIKAEIKKIVLPPRRAVAAGIDFSSGPAVMEDRIGFQGSQWDYRILQEDLLEAAKVRRAFEHFSISS